MPDTDAFKTSSSSSSSDDDHLDEEDFELIEENTGRRIKPAKKFKRLQRRIRDDESSSDFEDEVVSAAKSHTAPLENMFDESEENFQKSRKSFQKLSSSRYSDEADFFEDEEEEEEDDIANFIEEDMDNEEDNTSRLDQKLNKLHKSSRSSVSKTQTIHSPSSSNAFSDAWQEMNDIFGEGFDLEMSLEPQDDISIRSKSVSLDEIYEPAEIAAKLFTTEDEAIRVIDIPERIQLRDGHQRPPISETELRMESVYIAFKIEKLAKRPLTDEFRKQFLNAIAAILKFIREDFFEIPFIATHRKEYFQEYLSLDDLWAIYDYDEKWKILQERKAKILSFLELRENSSIDETHLIHYLNKAELEEEDMEDCLEYINYKYGKDSFSTSSSVNSGKSTAFKRPVSMIKRIDGKSELLSSKSPILHEFLPKIGITPRQFGINLTDMMKRFEPEDATVSPQTLIQSMVSTNNSDPEVIKENAISLLAKDFSMEPFVRKAFRALLGNSIFISTHPTEKGIHEISATHEYAHIKFLQKKPMFAFVDSEFLELLEAEKVNLLNVVIDVEFEERYYRQVESFFMSETYSLNAEKWNPFRKQILKDCVDNHIMPYLKKRFCQKMKKDALETVGKFCQHSLTEKLLFGKFIQPESSSNSPSTFMAVSWYDGAPGSLTYAVVINEEGALVESLRLSNMLDRNKKPEDLEKLSEFIAKHQPCVIGVSGISPNFKYSLLADIQKLVSELRLSGNQAGAEVLIVDNDTALVYQHSKLAAEEFPSQPQGFCFTISLARRLLEPLCEFAKLANFENSILELPLNPFKSLIPPAELRTRFLDRALINVINLVGVDINKALRNPFYVPLLSFVCGLGPRKAQLLLRTITKRMSSGYLERRSDILRMSILGKRIFLNCASFIKIDSKYLPKRRQYDADILDSTRIHPESYDLARKIAADALEIEEPLDDDQNPSAHVEELMNEPSKLNDLLLDEYAKELEKNKKIKKAHTLKDISAELQAPFCDWRSFSACSIERIFEMLTGETDRTIFPGLVLSAEVTRISEKFVNVRLIDGSLIGSISARNLADHYIERIEDVVSCRQIVLCKILNINKERCALDLSMKPSDLTCNTGHKALDPYYDKKKEASLMSSKNTLSSGNSTAASLTIPSIIGSAAYRAVLSSKPGSRSISHPLFKNVNRIKAESLLADGEDGDIIIRPSSKGFDFVVISWRLSLDVYHHIEVREENKDTPWTLGHSLFIGSEKFDDLDEIVARYMDPLINCFREVTGHAKYLSSITGKKDIELQLRKLKAQQPKRIIYGLSMVPEQPCSFLLSFLPFETTYHEAFCISSSGLLFRDKKFASVDDLLNFFKQDHMTRQQQQQQKQRVL